MYNYLEPVDDGLLMRETGSWVAEKLGYMQRYIAVLVTSMHKRAWPALNYIDLFAGPGKCRDKETGHVYLGSPLLALTARYPFTTCYLNDIDASAVETLRMRCSASASTTRLTFYQGDANVVVKHVIADLKAADAALLPNKYRSSLNLAVLDPEGLELHWSTIEALASVDRMDLIVYYPQQAITRNIDRSATQPGDTAIDGYFGSCEWRTIYRQTVSTGRSRYLHRYLMDYYKRRLGELGYVEARSDDEVYEPLMRNAQRNAPMYRLLFASKHTLGIKFWREVARRDVHGQHRLFEH